MKPITVNLKHLYQNREMWFWYLECIFIMSVQFFMIRVHVFKDQIIAFNIVVMMLHTSFLYIIGSGMGRLAAEVWSKTFSFCLPGKVDVARKLLLLVGIIVTIISFFSPEISMNQSSANPLGNSIGLMSFYFMIYWLSALTAIRFNRVFLNIHFYSFFLIFFIGTKMGRSGMLTPPYTLFVDHPLFFTCIFGTASYIIYSFIGRKNLSRSVCGESWRPLFPTEWSHKNFNRSILKRKGEKQKFAGSRFADAVNHYFSECIKKNNRSVFLPYMWGRVYLTAGSLLRIWAMMFFIWLLLIVFYSMFSPFPDPAECQVFLFYFCAIPGASLCLTSGSDILLPHGRKQRFFIGIIALIAAMLVILSIGCALILLSKFFLVTLPSFFFMGRTLKFIPLQFKFLFIPTTLMPAIVAGLILEREKQTTSHIILLTMAILFLLINHYILSHGGYAFTTFNLFIVILATVISWGFHLAVLYYTSMKTSISNSGR